MTARYETVIVGGGHAGLALSYHLSRLGRPHVILERGRVAERWRSERWDSLMFQFPNWSLRLPGHEYHGSEPDGFATRGGVIAFIERYQELVAAPVRTGVRVDRVRAEARRFRLETTEGPIEAANVVVATGPYQEPIVPALRHALPPSVLQVHASGYRNPAQLPAGAVLVVGSGASGCQIVEDLLAAGRPVYLSVGRHRRYPRRYRGRDLFWWMERIGALDLIASGIMSVVWATGFRRDFGWVDAPVLDDRGEPIHQRGVTGCEGLYFLGLPWLHKLKSSVLCGVGDDAAHLADHIAAGAARPRPGLIRRA